MSARAFVRPWFVRWFATIAAALLAIFVTARSGHVEDRADRFLAQTIGSSRPLPPGLVLPGDDPSIHDAVSIAASDIDDDGDLDVVANDGSLGLAVWENDGAGHFTRKRPVHDAGWQPDPPGPSWDPGAGSALTWIQSDPPTLGPDPLRRGAALDIANALSDSDSRPGTPRFVDSRTSRAPPSAA